jgi:HPt (histidine-containing phosphotransfer) domain-containing protein
MSDHGGVLDSATVRELLDGGGADLLAELVGLFNEDAPRHVARLREAVGGLDTAEVARLAHALKGSAATLGARLMSATCAELEAASRAGRTDVGPVMARLEQQTDDVLRALARLVAASRLAKEPAAGTGGAPTDRDDVGA